MQSIIKYVRQLLWSEGEIPVRKRDRDSLDACDGDHPAVKRFRSNHMTPRAGAMDPNENRKQSWVKSSNIRFIEVHSDDDDCFGPSTSTPAASKTKPRTQNKIVSARNAFDSNFFADRDDDNVVQKRQIPSGLENDAIEDRFDTHKINKTDDLDNNDIILIGQQDGPPRVFVEQRNRLNPINNEVIEVPDNDDLADDDVIYIRKLKKTPVDIERPQHNSILYNRPSSSSRVASPRQNSTFKMPRGIAKAKHSFNLISKSQSLLKRFTTGRFDSQRAIAESFRLADKNEYCELIRKSCGANKTITPGDTYSNSFGSYKFNNSLQKKLETIDLTLKSSKAKSNGVMNGNKDYVASISSSDSELEIVGNDDSRSSQRSIRIVNSLKKHQEDKPFIKADWLTELANKYKGIDLNKSKKLEECAYEHSLIKDINAKNYRKEIADVLKLKLSFKDLTVEIEEEEVVLPTLTDEQEKNVAYIFNGRNEDEVIAEKFRYTLRRRDLKTIAGLSWLNDEVINFYINLLMQRSQERGDLPKVFAMNTFFYPKLMASGHAGLKRWTKNVDIFAHHLMVIPVHLSVHWCMSVIDFRDKTIKYYDSMGGVNMACCNALLKYLEDEHLEKKKVPLDSSSWKKECVEDIPHQMNGSDCGMFACTFAEYICRNAPIKFTQKDMQYFRRKMVVEIKEGKLLL